MSKYSCKLAILNALIGSKIEFLERPNRGGRNEDVILTNCHNIKTVIILLGIHEV